jgi:hypothetical protein
VNASQRYLIHYRKPADASHILVHAEYHKPGPTSSMSITCLPSELLLLLESICTKVYDLVSTLSCAGSILRPVSPQLPLSCCAASRFLGLLKSVSRKATMSDVTFCCHSAGLLIHRGRNEEPVAIYASFVVSNNFATAIPYSQSLVRSCISNKILLASGIWNQVAQLLSGL